MLIQTNSTGTMVMKLVTGEEIICTVHNESTSTYEITNVLTSVMAFNPEHPNQGEVSFSPWMVGTDFGNIHVLGKSSVVASSLPSAQALAKYNIAIGTLKNSTNTTNSGSIGTNVNKNGLIARK